MVRPVASVTQLCCRLLKMIAMDNKKIIEIKTREVNVYPFDQNESAYLWNKNTSKEMKTAQIKVKMIDSRT